MGYSGSYCTSIVECDACAEVLARHLNNPDKGQSCTTIKGELHSPTIFAGELGDYLYGDWGLQLDLILFDLKKELCHTVRFAAMPDKAYQETFFIVGPGYVKRSVSPSEGEYEMISGPECEHDFILQTTPKEHQPRARYVFICRRCTLEVAKTEAELTAEERDALRTLGFQIGNTEQPT